MEIRCQCTACSATFRVDGKYAGRKIKCPKCTSPVTVPVPDALPSAAPPAGKPLKQPGSAAFPPVPKPGGVYSDSSIAEPTEFFSLQTGDTPTLPRPSAAGKSTAAGKPGSPAAARGNKPAAAAFPPNVLLLGGLGAGVGLLLLVAVVYFVFFSGPSKEKEKTVAKVETPKVTGPVLALDWAEADRTGATLDIDGKRRDFPAKGDIQLVMDSPGKHKIYLQRNGYEPIEKDMDIPPNTTKKFSPKWEVSKLGPVVGDPNATKTVSAPATPTRNYSDWLTDFDAAKTKAAAEKRDILVAIVQPGDRESDELANSVLFMEEFRKSVEKNTVLVQLDVTKAKDFKDAEESDNSSDDAPAEGDAPDKPKPERAPKPLSPLARWLVFLHVREVPCLVFADSQGRPYCYAESPEDMKGPLADFQRRLGQWRRDKTDRDEMFAKVTSAPPADQLDAAVRAIYWLQSKRIQQYYRQPLDEWLRLAQKGDPKNEKGQMETVFLAEWSARLMASETAQAGQVIEDLTKWLAATKLKNVDESTKIVMEAGLRLARPDTLKLTDKCLQAAQSMGTTDRRMLAMLTYYRGALSQIGRAVGNTTLSSGTGYVIDARGYLMTNNHVIDGEGKVVVRTAKGEIAGKVLAADKTLDMAIVQIKPPAGLALKPIPLHKGELNRGAKVAAFGFPLGDLTGKDIKLTTGIISAKPDAANENMYLTDCKVNPGNSGGPLCDNSGRVVGMVTAKSLRNSSSVESYGMARPVADVIAFAQKNIPGFKHMDGQEQKMEWDEVDQQVSPSVYMILKKR